MRVGGESVWERNYEMGKRYWKWEQQRRWSAEETGWGIVYNYRGSAAMGAIWGRGGCEGREAAEIGITFVFVEHDNLSEDDLFVGCEHMS